MRRISLADMAKKCARFALAFVPHVPPRDSPQLVVDDGQRFLMVKPAAPGGGGPTEVSVVQDWTEELKRLVPTR